MNELEQLRAENNRLKARLATYRAQCDHALSAARAIDRAKVRMEKLRNGALTLAGYAFTALVIIKGCMLIWR